MCGKGGGGTTTQVTNNRPPEEVIQNYNYVMDLAKNVQKTPFTPYSGEFVAPLSDTQKAGIANVNAAQGVAMPSYAQGAKYTMQGAQGVTPQFSQAGLQPYMSPYLNNVVGATMANINEQNAQQRAALQGSALSRGAYGGDRYGIGAANLARQQGLSTGQTISNLLQAGYGQALGQYNQNISQQQADQTRRLAAGQQLASLGEGAQKSLLSGAQAQLAAGAQEQATRQALDQAVYNQFLSQQAYPFQNLSWLGSLATGLGANMGGTSTSQTTAPASSGGANIFGALTAIASLPWSDERLKENKEVVGKTFDGQPIYKFNYKGDNTTQMGLMAQNVEKSHPDAVYDLGGLKKVDYDAALDDAADRGHYYSGGLAHPAHREHYAVGGGGSFGTMPYADLMKIPSIVPSDKIQAGRPTLSQPNTPAPNLAPKSMSADIVKGLQAMPDAAKKRMMKNLGDITGLGDKPIDVSKLKAGEGAAGLPSNMDQFTAGTYNYAPQSSSGGLGSWIGSLFGFADGGLVPSEGYADGGMIGRGTSLNARGLLPAGMADGGTPPEEDPMDKYARAISGIESGGRYDIVGPETRGDRPYGRFQVMGRNVGPWTEAALGQRMTPEEYLANKDAQDAVFRHRFGQYLKQTGSPEDAASMWFSGRPMAQAGNARDVLGTSVPSYVQKFRAGLGMADLPSASAQDVQFRIPRGRDAGSDGEEKGLIGRLTDTEGAPRSLLERITGMNLSDEARSGLLAAGLGMMASKSPNFLGALGEGGLGGLNTYYNALANKQNLEKQQTELGLKERETQVHEKKLGLEERAKNIEILNYLRNLAKGYKLSGQPVPAEIQKQIEELAGKVGEVGSAATPTSPATSAPTVAPAQTQAPAQTPAPSAPAAGEPKPAETTAPPIGTTSNPVTVSGLNQTPEGQAFLQQLPKEVNPEWLNEQARQNASDPEVVKSFLDRAEKARQTLEKDGGVYVNGQFIKVPGWDAAKAGTKRSELQAEDMAKTEQAWREGYKKRSELMSNIQEIQDTLERFQSGQLTDVKAKVTGIGQALGLDMSKVKLDQASDYEKFLKSSLQTMFAQVKDLGGRILVTEIESMRRASPDPTLQPTANRSVIGQMKGALNAENKFYEDYQKFLDGKGGNVAPKDFDNFIIQWKKENPLKNFVEEAKASTPVKGDLPASGDRKSGWQYVIPAESIGNPEMRNKYPKGLVATWNGERWVNERPIQ